MPNLARSLRGFGRRKPGPGARIDWSHPLANGLVSCLLINENGGGVVRDIASRNTFSFNNGPTWSPTPVGTGLNFVTASQQYLLGSFAPVTSEPLTIACVFTTALTATRTLVCIGDAVATNKESWNLTIGSTGLALAGVTNSAGTSSSGVGPNPPLAVVEFAYNHACAVYASASNRTGYMNGIAGTPDTTNIVVSGVGATYIGARTSAAGTGLSQFHTGLISAVFIWNRALLGAEVFQHFQDPFAFFQQPAPKRAFSFTKAAPPVTGKFQPAWARRSPVIGVGVY